MKITDIIDTNGLDCEFFSTDDPFSYIGASLKEKMKSLMSRLDVKDSPVIRGKVHPSAVIEGQVYIEKGAVVGPGTFIEGPTYIGAKAEVRHGAFIRGQVYVAEGAVVGHTTEVKGSVFCKEAKAGHFAYVGDSVLGNDVNLGAGTKIANFAFGGKEISYRDFHTGKRTPSGLRKFGCFMGDGTNTGCNSVINPGSILAKNSAVYPCSWHRGNTPSSKKDN